MEQHPFRDLGIRDLGFRDLGSRDLGSSNLRLGIRDFRV